MKGRTGFECHPRHVAKGRRGIILVRTGGMQVCHCSVSEFESAVARSSARPKLGEIGI